MSTTPTSPTVPEAWSRELSTRTERYAAGKALRDWVPHSSHAAWAPDPGDPIRSACWNRLMRHDWRTWCLFALDACQLHHLRSIADQQTSWQTTWPRLP